MPYITCDIRRGRSGSQIAGLMRAITGAVCQITGDPPEAVLVLVREHAGDHFMEDGELLQDYIGGADGEDVVAKAALARRTRAPKPPISVGK